jgi:toxin-antitoxin system PIN domain toxin
VLVDANLLLYAVDAASPWHDSAAAWLAAMLNGDRRVGIPWESVSAFLRISTSARGAVEPLGAPAAWSLVESWLEVPVVWVPGPTDAHRDVLGRLIAKYRISGNLVPDAHLAAIAIEHGLEVCSADTDFARFSEIRWQNPLAR